ncbi:MAG TPA: hypothetical protein ENH55_13270 [Aurantimonas coralicida]|uniref:Uncharacterized protein n=2 Tax=root TaxID=1 RepID=A0A9C9TFT2_9HYPH|nr:hypothetical protein [Aurantimonas coralicida]HET99669.1 hypothetical protein [Aurantimonas coralicida]
MTFNPVQQTSIHGRRLGLGSTGAILQGSSDGTKYAALIRSTADMLQNSTALLASQWGLNAQSVVPSSVGSTLTNYGLESLSSASATLVTGHQLGTPVVGVIKTIHLDCSGSEIIFGGTSTAMVFRPAIAGAGSSLSIVQLPLAGTVITLMGFASSEWTLISVGSSAAVVIG